MSISDENPDLGSGGHARRRRWSNTQKRQIVAEAHEPGGSVPMVAQRCNLNANQIVRCRRLFREPEPAAGMGRFVPVLVEGAPSHEAGAAALDPRSDDDVAEAGRWSLPGGRRSTRPADPEARQRFFGHAV